MRARKEKQKKTCDIFFPGTIPAIKKTLKNQQRINEICTTCFGIRYPSSTMSSGRIRQFIVTTGKSLKTMYKQIRYHFTIYNIMQLFRLILRFKKFKISSNVFAGGPCILSIESSRFEICSFLQFVL